MSTGSSPRGNLLLSTLPTKVLERAGIQEAHWKIKGVLISSGENPTLLFFPHEGAVASIVRTTTSGQMVETGVVGHEGMLNIHSVLSSATPTRTEVIVQGSGIFSSLETATVRELFDAHLPFQTAVLGYTSVFLDQVMQNLVCNRLHPIEQRLAKWLLVMRDRVLTDDLNLTQEFLSYMLGVHRPGVSIAVNMLAEAGLISHRRNWIELIDRPGVAARSCECYAPLRDKLRWFRQTFGIAESPAFPTSSPAPEDGLIS